MKRQNFEITFNGNKIIKHKWNSSIRETERLIKEIAVSEGAAYTLVDSVSNKEGFSFTNGVRTWKSNKGNVVTFEIKLLD